MVDAEDVVHGITPRPDVAYTAKTNLPNRSAKQNRRRLAPPRVGGGEVGPALGEIAIVAAVIPCLDEEDTIGNLGQRGNPASLAVTPQRKTKWNE
jgi:hypothetical protein